MTRLAAKDFPQQLLEYYDYYTRGKINKREFPQPAGKYTVGGMTVLAPFNLPKLDYALVEQVLFTDPDIRPEHIHCPSPDGHGEVRVYLMAPTKIAGEAPAVVMIYENRGLNPYIEDVARWAMKAGYIVLAPDDLSTTGDYPRNDDEGHTLRQKVDPVKLMNGFFAAVAFMAKHPQATEGVDTVGFCCGSGVSNVAAVMIPELACAVPSHNRQPPLKEVDGIRAPLLPHYTSLDSGTNKDWPVYEQASKGHHRVYETYLYRGVSCGFHSDSMPRYDRAVVDLTWQHMLARFEKYLRQRKQHK